MWIFVCICMDPNNKNLLFDKLFDDDDDDDGGGGGIWNNSIYLL